ncbi:MAG: hypothetical protein LBF94_02815 [Puniceicoccales bacterium]|jgi:hypothetical protein|nr:hypothetical protein [Puniceicoccales bacterium]
MPKPLSLKKVSSVKVKFDNVFVGKTRFLNFKVTGIDYFFTCHDRIRRFCAKILLGLRIGGFDSILALKACPDLQLFDKRFADMDLELVPEEIRVDVANMVFSSLLTDISAKLKLDITVASIAFGSKSKEAFEHEIGWLVYDKDSTVVLCGNLHLGEELLETVINSFEKIPANVKCRDRDVLFDVFLEAGRTSLSRSNFDNLEVSDIIFLDDDSQVRSGTFTLCGIDSPKITGGFEGPSFKISNVIGAV